MYPSDNARVLPMIVVGEEMIPPSILSAISLPLRRCTRIPYTLATSSPMGLHERGLRDEQFARLNFRSWPAPIDRHPGVRTASFQCSGSGAAPRRVWVQERGPSAVPGRNHRRGKQG